MNYKNSLRTAVFYQVIILGCRPKQTVGISAMILYETLQESIAVLLTQLCFAPLLELGKKRGDKKLSLLLYVD